MLFCPHPAAFPAESLRQPQIGLQQNAILRILCGDLLGFWAIFGHLEGEVSTQNAPKADFVETYA